MVAGKLQEIWAETLAIILLLIGFLIAILLVKSYLIYIVMILSGFLAGRIFFIKRFKEPIFPIILMVLGFVIGYVLGTFWASRFWAIAIFSVCFGVSYYLHLKKILKIFKGQHFVK